MDEFSVIKSVLEGNREDYRDLVEHYQEMVYRMLIRYLGEVTVARDLTHETFVNAYLALHTFRKESLFSTWLIRIALNCANSFLRTKKSQTKLLRLIQENGPNTEHIRHHDAETHREEQKEISELHLHTAISISSG